MLNQELTEEEIDQSIRMLAEINKDRPEMLRGSDNGISIIKASS